MVDIAQIPAESTLMIAGIDPVASPWGNPDVDLPTEDADGVLALYGEERILLVSDTGTFTVTPAEFRQWELMHHG